MRGDDSDVVTPGVDADMARLLIAAVSHGVRTPMHSLLGFLELLATTDLDDEAHNIVTEARAGGSELLVAGDRLLILLRLLIGDQPDAPQPFSTADLLHDVARTAGPEGAVWADANPYLPATLRGDVEALRQLLLELASNAARHGGRQTRLYAERIGDFTESPARVQFTVADDGPGLPAEALRRLSTRQERLGEEATQIGLYLACRLERRLGTTLTVAQSDDRGTIIKFDTLLYDTDAGVPGREPAVPVRAAAEPGAGSLHVLLIEDNKVNRILAERQMARLGHRLQIAVDGESGVRAVLDGDYDVVLMDRHLPDIDGIESTRRIRAGERTRTPPRHTPIIAVTADASPGHREECLAAGMDGFLTKPLDLEQLRAAIDDVTSRARPAGTAGAGDSDEPDFDPGAVGRLNDALGDVQAVADLVSTYLDDLPAGRMRLQVALGRSQARQAVAAAESLWASSETVGAVRLARLCEQIHRAASTGDVERGRMLLPDLREACDRTATALDRSMRSLHV
jgi:CheY-like chemotaxis protein/HPt (histidine-containing phosphotransfer) domain-containing protein/anti-sigma regulatory factor (Ser/Thr protein kinase)